MAQWQEYNGPDTGRHGHAIVGGSLHILAGLHSPQLDAARDILVYLPASHATGQRRYPVIYMHDGQNLFDPHTSFSGEWGVDHALVALDDGDMEAIVVAIPNAGPRRLDEYSPFSDSHHGGGDGDAYLRYITDTIKPIVDADFRTLPDREYTGLIGASMGGLISIFGFFERPEVFGFAGVMSPSLWFAEGEIFGYIEASPRVPGRLVVDVGTAESPIMVHYARRLRDALLAKGYAQDCELRYEEIEGAGHNEAAWGARLCENLRFLLPRVPTGRQQALAAD
jgi:predicted alpha/beta superfamily hydrolase